MKKRWLCLWNAWGSPETTQHKGGAKVADFLGPTSVLRKRHPYGPPKEPTEGLPESSKGGSLYPAAPVPLLDSPQGYFTLCWQLAHLQANPDTIHSPGRCEQTLPYVGYQASLSSGEANQLPFHHIVILLKCICVHVSSCPEGLPSRMEAMKDRSSALRLFLSSRTCACLTRARCS